MSKDVELTPVGKPEVKIGLYRNEFSWPEFSLTARAERINDDGKCELYVYHDNSNGRQLLHMGQANLLGPNYARDWGKALQARIPELDWHTALTYIAHYTIENLRAGQPVLNINSEPANKAVSWRLAPWLAEGEPTTIFGPGGKGKSVLGDLIAVIVTFGVRLPGLTYLVPRQGTCLYLDWERNEEIHRQRISAIKRTLGITSDREVHYIRCDHPISADIEYLCGKVADLKVNLIVIDSQMAATAGMGHGMTDAEVSSQYYNCLRRFGCTTLTIDHTTKNGMSEESSSEAAFGSIVKYNRATSVFSVKSIQETESDILDLELKHTKFNLGRKQVPNGIRIEFENDENDALTGLKFGSFDLSEHRAMARDLPDWQTIESIIRREPSSRATCATIAERAKEIDENTKIDTKRAYDVMNQKKKVFVKLEGSFWGLVYNTTL